MISLPQEKKSQQATLSGYHNFINLEENQHVQTFKALSERVAGI